MITECHICHKEIASTADVCPHCGGRTVVGLQKDVSTSAIGLMGGVGGILFGCGCLGVFAIIALMILAATK